MLYEDTDLGRRRKMSVLKQWLNSLSPVTKCFGKVKVGGFMSYSTARIVYWDR